MRRVGPDWLIGGNFGLEISVVALVVATAAAAKMLILAVRRGRMVPPMWLRERVAVAEVVEAFD